jgi:hypothetical protein
MPRRPAAWRRFATAARWPVGVGLTSWRYMWRTTPMHRAEDTGSAAEDSPPPLPDDFDAEDLQPPSDGAGPLFHRRYGVRISDPELTAEDVITKLVEDPNRGSPEFARFQKVHGGDGPMKPHDEYVVRMPGPWDGPVRVAEVTPRSFRLVTLETHLEAGQIEFRAVAAGDGTLEFWIESWARSGDRLSNLLYTHVRMAKEVQLHMWTSFLERVVKLAGGRRSGRLQVLTRRVDDAA